MPRLHVIYDPTDKLQTQPDLENRLKLKTASLSIPENLDSADIVQYAHQLTMLLLRQFDEP